jgi:hypothetical protein
MANQKLVMLYVLVTSRRLMEIEEILRALGAQRLALQSEPADPDIEVNVCTCLCDDTILRRISSVYGGIENRLTQGARRIYVALLTINLSGYPCCYRSIFAEHSAAALRRFQWVRCQLDVLRKCRTTVQVRATLRSLRRDVRPRLS